MIERKRFTIAILVRNQFGVLNRVTSMFRRRQFNIDALTVSETESAEFSRITVLFDGERVTKQQMVDQLYKLPDVVSIREFDQDEAVSCELLLIKMENDPASRGDILAAAEAYEAKTVNYTRDAIIMQLTGDSRRVDDFINLMRDYKILEICRTGVVSLERGADTIRKVTNL